MIRFATVVATEPEWSRLVAFVGFLWSKWPTHGPTVYGTETNWFVTFAFPKYARANKWSNSPCNWVYDEWQSANHAYFQLNTYVLQSNKGNRLRKLQKCKVFLLCIETQTNISRARWYPYGPYVKPLKREQLLITPWVEGAKPAAVALTVGDTICGGWIYSRACGQLIAEGLCELNSQRCKLDHRRCSPRCECHCRSPKLRKINKWTAK